MVCFEEWLVADLNRAMKRLVCMSVIMETLSIENGHLVLFKRVLLETLV